MHYCYVSARISRLWLDRISRGKKQLSKTAIKLWLYLHYIPGCENQNQNTKYIKANRRTLARKLGVDPKTVDAALASLQDNNMLLFQQSYTGIAIMLSIDPYMLLEGYITIEAKLMDELLRIENVAKLRTSLYLLLHKDHEAYSIDRVPTNVTSEIRLRKVVKNCKAEHLNRNDIATLPLFQSDFSGHNLCYSLDHKYNLRNLTDIYAAANESFIYRELDAIQDIIPLTDDNRKNIARLSSRYNLSVIKQAIHRFATAFEDQLTKGIERAKDLARAASKASETFRDSWKPDDREYVRNLGIDAYYAAQERYEIQNPPAYIRVVCEDLCMHYYMDYLTT